MLSLRRVHNVFFGVLAVLSVFSSSSVLATVSYIVQDPVTFEGNNHTFQGPVTYRLDYSSDTSGLILLDDPGLFSLRDQVTLLPVTADIFVRAINATSREIKIENIQGEGTFELVIDVGTAEDDDAPVGVAIAGLGNSFDVDKTGSVGGVEGPFADELFTTPAGPIGQNGTVYYRVDFADDALDPLTEVDLYPVCTESPNPNCDDDGDWVAVPFVPDYLKADPDDEDLPMIQLLPPDGNTYISQIHTKRVGDLLMIRVSEVTGTDADLAIIIRPEVAIDFAFNAYAGETSETFALDNPAGPEITIDSPSASITYGDPITFDIDYLYADTITLDEDDITLNLSGTATADVSVNGFGSSRREVVLFNFTGDGSISFNIAAGTAVDSAGDLSTSAGPSSTITVDTGGPIVNFVDVDLLQTETGPVTFTLNFETATSVSLLPQDLIVTTTGTVAFDSVEVQTVDLNDDEVIDVDNRNVVFTGLSGDGTLYFSVPANVAIDAFGIPSVASEDSPVVNVGAITEDGTLSISAPDPIATIIGPVVYEVTYAGVQAITLSPSDISLDVFGSATAATIVVDGVGGERTITLSDISGEGAIGITIADGTAIDGDGAPVLGATSTKFGVGVADDDGDFVPNGQEEFVDLTDKNDPLDYLDSDIDLVPDYFELVFEGTNELDPNDFGDNDRGLTPNYFESVLFANRGLAITNESIESDDQQDSDGDGLPDTLELRLSALGKIPGSYNPSDANLPFNNGGGDDDGDTILNGVEFYLTTVLGTSNSAIGDDFDRDGYPDYLEVASGLDPFNARANDLGANGISNRVHAAAGVTLTPDRDIDGDGLPDFIELVLDRSLVNDAGGDADTDGVSDQAESYLLRYSASDVSATSDRDGDGTTDIVELSAGFNANLSDTPAAWVNVRQGQSNQSVCQITKTGGDVTVNAVLGNMQTPWPSFSWTFSSAEITTIATINEDSLTFDPSSLEVGYYTLSVSTDRQSLVSQHERIIRVIDIDPLGESDKMDDFDQDGICDLVDPVENLEPELNTIASASGDISTAFGNRLVLGDLNASASLTNVIVDETTFDSSLYLLTGAILDIVAISEIRLTEASHFNVQNLPEAGGQVSLLMPVHLLSTVPTLTELSFLRVLTPAGLQVFTQTGGDQVLSSLAACGDSTGVFQAGVVAGANCLSLNIRDGGVNDLDGLVNGEVQHLSFIASSDEVIEELESLEELEEILEELEEIRNASPIVRTGKAGSLGLWVFSLLVMVGLARQRKNIFALHGFVILAVLLVTLPQSSYAEPFGGQFWKKNPFSYFDKVPLHKMYLGGALGVSGLEPEFSGNVYSVENDGDTGFKLWFDYEWSRSIFIESEYASLGATELGLIASPAAPAEDITYNNFLVSGMYVYPLPFYRWDALAKVGFGYSDIKSDLPIEVVDRFSPTFGLGVQYEFKKTYFARLEFETFNEDSDLISIGIGKKLRDKKKVIVLPELVAAEPAAIAPAEAPEEEVIEETPEVVTEESIEEEVIVAEAPIQDEGRIGEEALVEDLEQEIPWQEVFSQLKNDLEPFVLFERGIADLNQPLMRGLDDLIYYLDEYPDVRVIITGHACDVGHEYVNDNLSRMRSHGAKSYLQANGIDADRITARGRGEHFPQYANTDEDSRVRNRRIAFDFYVGSGNN